MISKKQKFV